MHGAKQEWRAELKRRRLQLTPQEVAANSKAIAERLETAIPWAEISALHCYEPIAALNEPDMNLLVAYLRRSHPAITIYTSRKHGREWRIERLDGQSSGNVPAFDAVIVPLLGFDSRLHRLGYGSGYYDRFLAAQPQARKIGVAYELSRVSVLPAQPHDVAVDLVVTEAGSYSTQA